MIMFVLFWVPHATATRQDPPEEPRVARSDSKAWTPERRAWSAAQTPGGDALM